MTTEPWRSVRRSGDAAVPMVTALAAAGGALAVVWSAATVSPVASPTASSSGSQQGNPEQAELIRAHQRLAELTRSLADVRRDLAELATTRLPTAVATGRIESGVTAPTYGGATPALPRSAAVAPLPIAAAPPPAHTTTGASSAPH